MEAMARSLGISKLYKTSVKEDMNVTPVFSHLAQQYMRFVMIQEAEEDGNSAEDDIVNAMTAPLFAPLGSNNLNNKKMSNKSKLMKAFSRTTKSGKNNLSDNTTTTGGSNNNNSKLANGNHNNLIICSPNGKKIDETKNEKGLLRNPVLLKSHTPPVLRGLNGNRKLMGYNGVSPPSILTPPLKKEFIGVNNTNGMNLIVGRNGMSKGYLRTGANNGSDPNNYIHYHHHSYSPYPNGAIGWDSSRVPFRLDLVRGNNSKKRKKNICSIL